MHSTPSAKMTGKYYYQNKNNFIFVTKLNYKLYRHTS